MPRDRWNGEQQLVFDQIQGTQGLATHDQRIELFRKPGRLTGVHQTQSERGMDLEHHFFKTALTHLAQPRTDLPLDDGASLLVPPETQTITDPCFRLAIAWDDEGRQTRHPSQRDLPGECKTGPHRMPGIEMVRKG